MNSPLRVLHLEDDVRDTELVRSTLEAERIQTELRRVENEQDFLNAVGQGNLDFILADYTLPSFDGLSALKIAKQHAPDVPFIFVSGTLGEDVAIEALKTGATDYVLKTRLARLGPSVTRALAEAREKAERKRAEAAVRQSQKELRDVINTMPANVWSTLPDGTVDFVNRRWQEFTGLPAQDALGWNWEAVIHPDDRSKFIGDWRAALENGKAMQSELRLRRKDGKYRWWFVRNVPLHDEAGKIVKWYGTAIDIEDRKRAEALLAGEKRILEMVAKGDSLTEILEGLCRLVEGQAIDVLASVLLLDGNRLQPVVEWNRPGLQVLRQLDGGKQKNFLDEV